MRQRYTERHSERASNRERERERTIVRERIEVKDWSPRREGKKWTTLKDHFFEFQEPNTVEVLPFFHDYILNGSKIRKK